VRIEAPTRLESAPKRNLDFPSETTDHRQDVADFLLEGKMQNPYDYRNCQSLFGYAARVHERSGAICQLCAFGFQNLDFDLWRQLTVEHLIGSSQGGYLREIEESLCQKFPDEDFHKVASLGTEIDAANTITACSFCNSTTSRDRAPQSMDELIQGGPDDIELMTLYMAERLSEIYERKRDTVRHKVAAVRAAYDELVANRLLASRNARTE
jgi:hypothetical protein